MQLRGKRIVVWVVVAIVVIAAIFVLIQRVSIMSWLQERPYRESIPTALPAAEFDGSAQLPMSDTTPTQVVSSPKSTKETLAAEINLAVPFAPQAPFANWEQPYQDACEETTVIMVERYLRGVQTLSLQEADTEILKMVDLQTKRYGFFKDSNIAETVRMAEAFYPHLSAQAHFDVTAADIREALGKGQPPVVLVDGRKLGNPFYTPPGPDRHTLVIKGVVGDKFITNDPGTKRGADFVYPISTVLNAMVDYDGQTPGTGKRAMILFTLKK